MAANGYHKLSVQMARVEEQLGSLAQKVDQFIATALSPESGYVARSELSSCEELNRSARGNIELRLDNINHDHNERLVRLERAGEQQTEVLAAVRRQVAYASGAAGVIAAVFAAVLHFWAK